MQDQQTQQHYNMEGKTQQDQIINLLKLPTYQNQNNLNLLNNMMSNPNNQNLLMNQQQQDVYKQIQQPYLLQNQKSPKEPMRFINNYNKQQLPNSNNSAKIPPTLGITQQQQYIYQNQYMPEDISGYQLNYVDTMQQQYPIPYTAPMPVPLQQMESYFQYNQPQYQSQYQQQYQQYQQQQYGLGVQGVPKMRYYGQEEDLDNIIFPSEQKLKKNPRRSYSRENRRRRSRSKSRSRDVKRGHKKKLNMTLSEGDWECNECKNWNFKRREKCNQCGLEKSNNNKVYSESRGDSKRDRERMSVTKRISHNQKGYKPKEGDWECKECKNINYARREVCNRCSNKRPN